MKERGSLVRNDIPSWIEGNAGVLGPALGVDDVFAEGSNGAGRNARVPWTRFGSRLRAPKPTEGFYVVYLFDARGQMVYLSLNQGTTSPGAHAFVPKPAELILERTLWARSVLADWMEEMDDPAAPMPLHDIKLGAEYEKGNIASIGYELGSIPDDGALLADAKRFAEGLGIIYREHDLRPLPKEQPEVREAEEAADRATGKRPGRSGAGFRTNAAEIKVIENHAVALARTYYEAEGFEVKILGKPFDLKVTKGDLTLTVEVKGTTSDGGGVVLTGGEVRHHEKAFPDNALVIARNITLHRHPTRPKASGGHLYELRAWQIDENALRVISYAYRVPAEIYDHSGVTSDSLL
jgi:MrcB-like, N-terminal domain